MNAIGSFVQAASKAILLIPDPDLHLILSRQIGDDGAHAIAFRERIIALTGPIGRKFDIVQIYSQLNECLV